jgi:hypothetical protein
MNNENSKRYDLEDRTLAFAKAIRCFVKNPPKTRRNGADAKQLIRASGSISAKIQ